MGRKTGKSVLKTVKFPVTFSWIILKFENSPDSVPLQTSKHIFRNFNQDKLSIEIYYEKWYQAAIICHAGKKFTYSLFLTCLVFQTLLKLKKFLSFWMWIIKFVCIKLTQLAFKSIKNSYIRLGSWKLQIFYTLHTVTKDYSRTLCPCMVEKGLDTG